MYPQGAFGLVKEGIMYQIQSPSSYAPFPSLSDAKASGQRQRSPFTTPCHQSPSITQS